jgi:hypothetical protein
VKVDSPGDAGLSGGEVAGFLGFPRAGAVRAVADGEARDENLEQERGEGKVRLVRGKATTVSVAAARACGKLILAGRMPGAFTAMPMILQIASLGGPVPNTLNLMCCPVRTSAA